MLAKTIPVHDKEWKIDSCKLYIPSTESKHWKFLVNKQGEVEKEMHNVEIPCGDYSIYQRIDQRVRGKDLDGNPVYNRGILITFPSKILAKNYPEGITKNNLSEYREIIGDNTGYDIKRSGVAAQDVDLCIDYDVKGSLDEYLQTLFDEIPTKTLIKRPRVFKSKEKETVQYGERGQSWFAKVYDKITELNSRGKKRFFIDKLGGSFPTNTRFEVNLRGTEDFRKLGCTNLFTDVVNKTASLGVGAYEKWYAYYYGNAEVNKSISEFPASQQMIYRFCIELMARTENDINPIKRDHLIRMVEIQLEGTNRARYKKMIKKFFPNFEAN